MGELNYGFKKKLQTKSFEEAKEQVRAALKDEGFGVLTEIDMQAKMKEKLNVDFQKYVILGACNPPLAHQALETESHLGLLLPCNVVLQETKNGDVEVSFVDPKALFTVVDDPETAPAAEEAFKSLSAAFQKLQSKAV